MRDVTTKAPRAREPRADDTEGPRRLFVCPSLSDQRNHPSNPEGARGRVPDVSGCAGPYGS